MAGEKETVGLPARTVNEYAAVFTRNSESASLRTLIEHVPGALVYTVLPETVQILCVIDEYAKAPVPEPPEALISADSPTFIGAICSIEIGS
jgi:hypothetical protein